jgi:hypothetical protein
VKLSLMEQLLALRGQPAGKGRQTVGEDFEQDAAPPVKHHHGRGQHGSRAFKGRSSGAASGSTETGVKARAASPGEKDPAADLGGNMGETAGGAARRSSSRPAAPRGIRLDAGEVDCEPGGSREQGKSELALPVPRGIRLDAGGRDFEPGGSREQGKRKRMLSEERPWQEAFDRKPPVGYGGWKRKEGWGADHAKLTDEVWRAINNNRRRGKDNSVALRNANEVRLHVLLLLPLIPPTALAKMANVAVSGSLVCTLHVLVYLLGGGAVQTGLQSWGCLHVVQNTQSTCYY